MRGFEPRAALPAAVVDWASTVARVIVRSHPRKKSLTEMDALASVEA